MVTMHNMNFEALHRQILKKHSFLCIGLDPVLEKLPAHLHAHPNPVLEFNKAIIDATHDLCVAYKPNTAFYESMGVEGWQILKETIDYIPDDILIIADAKRGDIGNTSKQYASAMFDSLGADAITVSPYMGSDSIHPFYGFDGKWVIILGLTSNKGSADFQMIETDEGKPLYLELLWKAKNWSTERDTMFVIGATHPQQFRQVREVIPLHFILVPGVGAQGGSLDEVCKYGMNDSVGLLINSSRGIIYAGDGEDFAQKSREVARALQCEMAQILKDHKP